MEADPRGPNPKALEKLFGQLKGMAQAAKASVRKQRKRIFAGPVAPQMPRQICDVCNVPFDFVAATKEAPIPVVSRCVACKQMLAAGMTALVQKPKVHGAWMYAWVKGGGFKPGEVVKDISEEVMTKVLERSHLKVNGHTAPDAS
jgi:hypothetical protein